MIKILVAGPIDHALEKHHLPELQKKIDIEILSARSVRTAERIVSSHQDISVIVITEPKSSGWSAKNLISRIRQNTNYNGLFIGFALLSSERKAFQNAGCESFPKSDFPKRIPMLLGFS